MAGWQGSDRRQRLPSNWQVLRRDVFERDGYQCTELECEFRCQNRATDVDHVVAGDDHSLANLRALCTWHHKQKSSAEGVAARKAKPGRKRPKPQHPGWS